MSPRSGSQPAKLPTQADRRRQPMCCARHGVACPSFPRGHRMLALLYSSHETVSQLPTQSHRFMLTTLHQCHVGRAAVQAHSRMSSRGARLAPANLSQLIDASWHAGTSDDRTVMRSLHQLLSTLEDLQILFVVSTVCPRHALIALSWRGPYQLPFAMCGLV